MKVFVYFNLHKKCFSIKALEGSNKGKVIAHRNNVVVYCPTFKVSEAGRQRVLREKKKNVHAGVVGQWLGGNYDDRTVELIQASTGAFVTYNPYKYSTFVYRSTELPVTGDLRAAALSSQGGKATMSVTK